MTEDKQNMEIFEKQECPMCSKPEATYTEYETPDPYAKTIYILSVTCRACGYKKADLEFEEPGKPAEYTLKVESSDDLNIRVIKSADCEIKIPKLGLEIDSTFNGEHFVSNVEGVLSRFRKYIEFAKQNTDEKTERKRAKNLLKKLDKVESGEETITLKLRDNTGNSAIISDKVTVKKIKA